MEKKGKIWNEIYSFISEYFPNAYGVMVTGSFVTKYFNESSDIDIIILSNIYRATFIDTYFYHEIKMQAIVFPVFDLESLLKKDIQNGGLYLNQIYKGKIIKDRNNIFKEFKILAESIYIKGPVKISRFNLDQARARITTRLEDLEGNDNYSDNLFTILDLYPRIVELYFQANSQWTFFGKNASHILEDNNPNFKKKIVNTVGKFIKNKDKGVVLDFVKDFLKELGGEMHFSTTREYGDKCDKDNLVVFISGYNNSKQIEDLKQIANKAEDFICKHIDGISTFSYLYPDNQIYKSGLYLIFYLENYRIETELLPLVEMFHLDLNNSSYRNIANCFYYPFNSNPFDVFGNTPIQKLIANSINKIKAINTKNNELLAYNILQQLKVLSLFQNDNAWIAFWEFFYRVLDNSNNNLYVPQKLLKYYSENQMAINKARYLSFIDSQRQLFLSKNFEKEFKDIVNMFNEDTSYSFTFSKEGLCDSPYLKGHVNLCIFIINLIEVILNSLYLNQSNKLFIIFAILKATKLNVKN